MKPAERTIDDLITIPSYPACSTSARNERNKDRTCIET
jgi:hypothetical protein